ncbi:MAG: 3-dehydroquinate synthase [Dehalococcoidia bacterium]|nr:3-dehydroquinate synthase [Dehalococcoidia bacterium]
MAIDKNIIIIGFSGTGKSQAAREVAKRLNWNFIDTDDEIVKRAGKPVTDIFRDGGEDSFRDLERQVIAETSLQEQAVIAVGGGAIVDLQNYESLARSGIIICLEAKAETIYRRLFQGDAYGAENEVRPLLDDDNPLDRISHLKASRQFAYAGADWTIHTDGLSISEVADEIIRSRRLIRRCAPRGDDDKSIVCWVDTPSRAYPVFVEDGLLNKLGVRMREAGLSGTAVVISDENVFSFYGNRVKGILQDAGFNTGSFVISPGEMSKSLDQAGGIYDFLVRQRIERGDVIVALGGGVVGDLAGFIAATFLRGISWVQVPTSLVAMVDASIGGKVGVNHSQGKNLIGSFYQPHMVLADCQTLDTLPRREMTSGWAEVIKYGLIIDRGLFEFLQANVDRIGIDPAVLALAIGRSAAIKAGIVSEDEKEKGKRILLNYGHTIAHGLEAATHYERFLHGEAVSIGMVGAAGISQRMGFLTLDVARKQQRLLEGFELPVKFSGIDVNDILEAMTRDKKTRGKTIQWVLLRDAGNAIVCNDVPEQVVSDVLQELKES